MLDPWVFERTDYGNNPGRVVPDAEDAERKWGMRTSAALRRDDYPADSRSGAEQWALLNGIFGFDPWAAGNYSRRDRETQRLPNTPEYYEKPIWADYEHDGRVMNDLVNQRARLFGKRRGWFMR
jgi:hypothetical protein